MELLLVAMAPDIDARFERLYGYLNDDLTRRRPAIGLALELCGLPAAGSGRFRFQPPAPLVAGGLLEVTDPERPLLSRTSRSPDRITAHLLGDDEPDGRLRGLAQVPAPGSTTRNGRVHDDSARDDDRPEAHRIAAALATGSRPGAPARPGRLPSGLAVEALTAAGRRPLVVDIAALAAAGNRRPSRERPCRPRPASPTAASCSARSKRSPPNARRGPACWHPSVRR
ncbi:hypothetical protein SCYAM73S_01496 [Streptomyces cyaneofuscatus]